MQILKNLGSGLLQVQNLKELVGKRGGEIEIEDDSKWPPDRPEHRRRKTW